MSHLTALLSRPARRLALVLALLVVLAAPACAAASGSQTGQRAQVKPTIVLVHGAWADASGWDVVMGQLQRDGYTVLAVANPLRDLPGDSAYLASVLHSITGPIVLVGHSYGGAVITNAALGNPQVKALVYVAAFAPDAGESLTTIEMMNPGSEIGPTTLVLRPFPGGVDAYISPASFHSAFCADVPAALAAEMGASQRPISAAALAEPSGPPAWRTIPSWYLVATEDHAIPPVTERFMAKRMEAHTVEVASSHAALVARPGAVTNLILDAVHHTS
ncbi:MAG: alpha/beta hydrolase [Acidimicrobiia bacterium]|nr:alpha/beta hydrolase [Acidimicrobiia bacterium]